MYSINNVKRNLHIKRIVESPRLNTLEIQWTIATSSYSNQFLDSLPFESACYLKIAAKSMMNLKMEANDRGEKTLTQKMSIKIKRMSTIHRFGAHYVWTIREVVSLIGVRFQSEYLINATVAWELRIMVYRISRFEILITRLLFRWKSETCSTIPTVTLLVSE